MVGTGRNEPKFGPRWNKRVICIGLRTGMKFSSRSGWSGTVLITMQETKESVTFSSRDLANRDMDSERPLYVTTFLGASQIRRALVDTSASTNILPLLTLDALGIPRERIIWEPLKVARIGSLQQCTLGHVSLDLRVGPIRASTFMHVRDGDTSYHVILGRPWLKAHKVVVSMYHQCMKAIWRGRPVTIEATTLWQGRAPLCRGSFVSRVLT